MRVTEEDWQNWLEHPATKALREWATVERKELMELWANGVFSAAFTVEMAVKNAGATGACSIYSQVSDLDYLVIIGEEDGEPFGPTAERQGGFNPTI